MTIEEIRKQGPATDKHYRLKTPGGVEFVGLQAEICSPKSPVNWQLCEVIAGPMTLSDAMQWNAQHRLSTEQINKIEEELMFRAPAKE